MKLKTLTKLKHGDTVITKKGKRKAKVVCEFGYHGFQQFMVKVEYLDTKREVWKSYRELV